MNFKKLFTTGILLVLFLVTGVANAQVGTYYVNNQTGNDANPGTQALPKLTVGSALIAAPSGSTISVAATGVNYVEGAITVKGTYTFTATGGTPIFSNANFNLGGAAVVLGAGNITTTNPAVFTSAAHGLTTGDVIYVTGTGINAAGQGTAMDNAYWTVTVLTANTFSINYNNTGGGSGIGGAGTTYRTRGTVTFTSAFQFQDINLNQGTLAGGNFVLVNGGDVYRTELATVTGQFQYTGATNFVYENITTAAGVTITTGPEFPTTTNIAAALTTIATAGNITLKLDQNRTINGLLSLGTGANAGGADLNGFTLFLNTGAFAHTTDGNITGGTLEFTLTGNASIEGVTAARTLPNINVTSAGAFALTVSPGGALISTVGNVVVNGTAGMTMQNTGNIGNITLNGSGNVTTLQVSGAGATTIGDVLASSTSTGNITLDVTVVGGSQVKPNSLTMSGRGIISFGANTTANNYAVIVATNVLLNTQIAWNNATLNNVAQINFNNGTGAVTISGTLTNSAQLSGTNNVAGASSLNGMIQFLNTGNVTVTGTTLIQVSGTVTLSGGATLNINGGITFASTAIGSFGAITNNSTSSIGTNVGTLTSGTFAGGFTTGLITNSSLTDGAANHGDINFAAVTAATLNIGGASQTGAALGGDILLGAGGASNFNFTGDITNSRSVANSNINVGAGAVTGTVTAPNITNTGASAIIFLTTTGNVTVNNTLSLTGSGNISFAAATTATFGIVNITINGTGILDFGDETVGGGTGATGAINITGTAQFLNGTVAMSTGTGGRTMTLSGASIQIGGLTTNVTFIQDATATLAFGQPIPNVNQMISLGTADQTYGGPVTVTNPAVLPAPYVYFQSAGATPGKLTLTGGGLTFNTGGLVVNTVRLDNARLYVGKNNPGGSAGNFQNTTGYSTTNGGFVMMNGNALQTVNAGAITAGALFGNFGVDNNSGATPAVTFGAATATMTGEFYLAEGQVSTTNLIFNNGTTFPTIFRTEGTFNATLTGANLGSNINVTYYGSDKTTAQEIPNYTVGTDDKLWNLTVATTTGVQPGQGIVTMGTAVKVNGTLTVNTGQTLYTAANVLQLAGASAVVDGWLVDNGTNTVQLVRAGGTALTGAGIYPSLIVNNGSNGNTLVDGAGLVSNGLGDGLWGGGNDDFATRDGNIVFAGGAAASSLAVTFTGAGPHVAAVTTALNGTLTLNSNLVASGAVAVGTGTIALGNFDFTVQNAAFSITGGAAPFGQVTSGTGTLIFSNAAANLTIGTGAATIAANVQFTGAAATFNTNNLRFDGNVTLGTATPTANTFTIPNGLTLTAGGLNVTLYGASAFVSPATGILSLVNTAPNTLLTWTVPAAATPTVANLTVGGNVTLAGPASLTVNGTGSGFVMNTGTLTIGNANLNIGNATATPFVYNGGTITGTGYLVWNSTATWTQTANLVLTNFQVNLPLDLTNANANTNTLTVNTNLYLNGAVLTQTRTVAPLNSLLTLADLITIRVDGGGNINNAAGQLVPNFVGMADYLFRGAASAPNQFTWPATVARDVTINMGAAVNTVTPTSNRTIARNLTEIAGQLFVNNGITVDMPNAGSIITRDRNNGTQAIALAAAPNPGIFTANDVNLVYTDVLAVGTTYNTGPEYANPTTVRDISVGPGPAASTTNVTIVASRTIAGTLSMFSTLHFGTNTTTNWTLAQTIPLGSTVIVDAGGPLPLLTLVNWNGGLTVTGTYTNNGTTAGNISGTGAINNNGIMNLTGLNHTTGLFSMFNGSSVNLTGAATFGPLSLDGATTYNVAVPPAMPVISTSSNLTFAGTWVNNAGTGAGFYLNLTFTGTNNQTVALGANRTIQNVNMTKGNDGTVTFSGGNLTLNAAVAAIAPGIGIPAGILTLTRGILVMTDPTLLTLQLTTNAGGIITNLGYVRNLAQATDFAHVVGRLGVFIPAGTIGRSEWPVGSINPHYRPAAITFTAGNATIAPTTIIVNHVDSEPTGIKNFPINGGTKFADASKTNWIGGKAPYHWSFEATTSLGAAQLMNVELNGTNLNRPLENHNDLRIIRRFDGDVQVNGWFLEGGAGTYSNAMYINTPAPGDTLLLVRNIGSLGSAISQKALFTIGIPSGAPIFTNAAPPANATENVLYTFTFTAIDQDVNVPAPTFGLVNPPAGATINATTGVFEWTPGYDQGSVTPYNLTVRAYKGNDNSVYTDYPFAVTVANVNRAPSFTGAGTATEATATMTSAEVHNFTYAAVDEDGDALTYAIDNITPAFAGTSSISATLGTFTFTPVFADAGKVFTVTISATDPSAAAATTTTAITVNYPVAKGDVDGDGDVDGIDASLVLQYVVGKITFTAVQLYAADVNNAGAGDGVVGAYDAYGILYNQLNGIFPAKANAAMGTVEFGSMTSENGLINVPVSLKNTGGVNSVYAEFTVGSGLEIETINARLPEGWTTYSNVENGTVKIAMVGDTELSDGPFAVMSFRIKDEEASVTVEGKANLNDILDAQLNSIKVREIPTEFALSQNYPNPFNPTTTIKYAIPENAHVTLVVYDMLGQVVRKLVDSEQEAGFYTMQWDGTSEYGSRVASGIYIYRIMAGKYTSTMKMNLLK